MNQPSTIISVKNFITPQIAQKILGNKANALVFLDKLGVEANKNLKSGDVYNLVSQHWDFKKATEVIRNMFVAAEKYESGKVADKAMEVLLNEWQDAQLGKVSWPFSQGDFDGFVQRLNSENTQGSEKDAKVKKAAVMYRRIKEINTLRNDFIETLVFEKNKNVIPTLSHRRGVDFFVNGEQYDQKVASSPTKEFMRDFEKGEIQIVEKLNRGDIAGDILTWKKTAIQNPALVAQYLYTYQDEGRFGADNRLLVVYLDEDITAKRIKEIINKTDLEHPLNINFEYKHKIQGVQKYRVKCFVILLYKNP